jgi:acylphosphatase
MTRQPEDRSPEHGTTEHVTGTPEAPTRVTAFVEGRVQGVGFRFWVRDVALNLGLAGSATNLPGGQVEVVVEGTAKACEQMLALLRGPLPPGRVLRVSSAHSPPRGTRGFAIQ